ncbi:hypothetical protein DmGdi_32280 [Gluconobacter sp. Gdi]|nr:hypothetical protein DmGdi_32280 [Gluconobacter sp. Gdi]
MADDRVPGTNGTEVAMRMAVLRPYLIDNVPLTKVAVDAAISIRTVRRWIARYRLSGPAGLMRPMRPEAGTRTFPKEMVELIEGMALLKPPSSIAAIHRRIVILAAEQGWRKPSYGSVRSIVREIDPAMLTLAHESSAVFRDKYELVHRHRGSVAKLVPLFETAFSFGVGHCG